MFHVQNTPYFANDKQLMDFPYYVKYMEFQETSNGNHSENMTGESVNYQNKHNATKLFEVLQSFRKYVVINCKC